MCAREAPEVAQLARAYDGRITFLGVAGFDRVAAMQTFVDTHDLHHLPHAASEDGALFGHFDLNFQPAWVLIDAQGNVVFRAARPTMATVAGELEALAGAR